MAASIPHSRRFFPSYRFGVIAHVGPEPIVVNARAVESTVHGLAVERLHEADVPMLMSQLREAHLLEVFGVRDGKHTTDALRFVFEIGEPMPLPVLFDAEDLGYALDRVLFRRAILRERSTCELPKLIRDAMAF